MTRQPSINFAYLDHHDPRLVMLATQAEQQFAIDPEVCLFKLRKFGELLAQRAAAKVRMWSDPHEEQIDLVNRLSERGVISHTQRYLFHELRKSGNAAVHQFDDVAQSAALHQLKVARELAIWFQRSFGHNAKFNPGPFVPPRDPAKHNEQVRAELARLRAEATQRQAELDAAEAEIDRARKAAEAQAHQRLSAEQRAAETEEETALWEVLAAEQSEQSAAENAELRKALQQLEATLHAELARTQQAAEAESAQTLTKRVNRAAKASDAIYLDEAATRKIIDAQLRDAGWEADIDKLCFARGTRPQKNRNMAIAEWPTETGPADYVLFAGERAIAVVEAKRHAKDVAGVITQAKRYSRGYKPHGHYPPVEGGPWSKYRVPFLFATNGRPFMRQLKTKSGIWFLDARRKTNTSNHLDGWTRPTSSCATSPPSTWVYAIISSRPSPRSSKRWQRAGANCSWRWPPVRVRRAPALA